MTMPKRQWNNCGRFATLSLIAIPAVIVLSSLGSGVSTAMATSLNEAARDRNVDYGTAAPKRLTTEPEKIPELVDNPGTRAGNGYFAIQLDALYLPAPKQERAHVFRFKKGQLGLSSADSSRLEHLASSILDRPDVGAVVVGVCADPEDLDSVRAAQVRAEAVAARLEAAGLSEGRVKRIVRLPEEHDSVPPGAVAVTLAKPGRRTAPEVAF